MESWTLTWTTLTSLNTTSINSIPQNISGVYRLSYKSADGNYYVFYVGKAQDLKQRLNEHISESETNVCIKNHIATKDCHFRYAIVVDERVRSGAEKQLFDHYEPTCNETRPEGPNDIKTNLD